MSNPGDRNSGRKQKIEKLELSKETVQNLTEGEAEAVEGGVFIPRSKACTGKCPNSNTCTKALPCNTYAYTCVRCAPRLDVR